MIRCIAVTVLTLMCIAPALASHTMAETSDLIADKVDWPAFMKQHDMTFDRLPQQWFEAPHFGNASIGSMLYQYAGRSGKGEADNTLRLQVFRADVQDHRDNSYGWTAYSRPRLMIGHFSLHPMGTLTGCSWRKDLWNAELTGKITTDKGEILIRHFTHAEDMAIVTELTPSAGEEGCRWTWHPVKAQSTRGGYPTKESEIPAFADRYGDHYNAKTLKLFKANPEGYQDSRGTVSVWTQDLLAGGQHATAWSEQSVNGVRRHLVSIAHSYPESTAAETALSDVERCQLLDRTRWQKIHRAWWQNYYRRSFVSIPDKSLESLYWQTIYRLGCTSRTGRAFIDTAGLWSQGGGWPYVTNDWNTQVAHWPVCAANRLEQGQELLERFHTQREELIKGVRPVQWQKDSAYLAITTAVDLIGDREQDMRYYDLVGNLPWTMHNLWLQYRYSMDDRMLRDKVYPLLRRSINLYLHMLQEGDDGKLHLAATYSPEAGSGEDTNFDLALLKWGCYTLLKASKRLGIDDPLIPRWKDVVDRLVEFPVDEDGFRLSKIRTAPANHRHLSHLLMIYPLYLSNIEQKTAPMDVLKRSYDHIELEIDEPKKLWMRTMVQAHAAPIAAALGWGDQTLHGLKQLRSGLRPNGLWYTPCMDGSVSVANIVQEMLIQSWTDPTKAGPGIIRIFPAFPSAWKDAVFDNLRTEGAFLVSAERNQGVTQWVRIKSLAGEPCLVRPGLSGKVRIKGNRIHKLKQVSPGIYEIDMKKGDEVLLYSETLPEAEVKPVE